MQADLELRGNAMAVITVVGRLTMVGVDRLRSAINIAVDEGHPFVVVDLTRVPFMDSSGLGALVAGLRTTRAADGDLRIARASDQVRTVLQLTSMDGVLPPYESVDDAYRLGSS